MKYIILKRTWNSFEQEVPVIFPEELIHKDVFDSIKAGCTQMDDAELVSAGFINIMDMPHCYGLSDSLMSESRGATDSERIRQYINDHGILAHHHETLA